MSRDPILHTHRPDDDHQAMRASHEDRDEIVEQLRVAAGDGRLTAEELDERLGIALEARTYGELAVLVRDLPATTAGPPAPAAAAVDAKDLIRLQAHHSNLQRLGPWIVPRRLEVECRAGNVVLDFTQAAIGAPVLDMELVVRHGNVRLIVPPEVVVQIDSVEMHGGNVHQRATTPEPGTPVRLLVNVSGEVRHGNVEVRSPRVGFRERRRRRQLQRDQLGRYGK
ncbi:DUF1707 SHOCT-like domain-containing protein [Streptacidiphilus carbonis]|jgi:hypothetical protein|uniref:DUF1707 SHOCT-like domain-containing protein n=1 Tax=Streptacidiphilus carbonis TaxID=105422 RepID=UPI0005A7187C|nr:DUF1707 domain-containing protein [Streptacidiphilus carbonis]